MHANRLRGREKVAMRRQVLLDALREHPWVTARMLGDRILEETGGGPTILTGALWVPPWTAYADLCWLRERGRVQSRHFSARTVVWAVVGE